MTPPNDVPSTAAASESATPPQSAGPMIGSFLARVVVPIWVLLGATFKLADGIPNKLPKTLLDFGRDNIHKIGLDLDIYLASFIAVELVLVGIMFFVPKLARAAAIFILSCFCAVLVLDLLNGNFTDCGCFGNTVTMPPWLMLIIDGGLLVGLIVLPTRASASGARTPKWSWPATIAWCLIGLTTVGVLTQQRRMEKMGPDPEENREQIAKNDGEQTTEDNGGETPPTPVVENGTTEEAPPQHVHRRPPGDYFYIPGRADSLKGQWFFETDIASFVPEWPDGMNEGKWYVIFYGPTCDHCQEVFQKHFAQGPPVNTVIVAIPEENGMPRSGVLSMPCPNCTKLELPSGLTWVFGTPVVFALEDGRIICAKEEESVDEPECLIWH